jgi:hypothetical protein
VIIALLTFVIAGIIKGAIGSGVPVVVVPVLTMLYDVKLAIAVLVAPNLFSNALQVWQYRQHLLPLRFLLSFAVAGGAGIVLGTWGLVVLSPTLLSLGVAAAILLYLIIKLAKRTATLPFMNAMQLERRVFIGSISVFFVAITLVQIPALLSAGILTGERTLYSLGALLVILAAMPIGAQLGRRLPHRWFDNLIMCLLASIALKIILDALLT